jgi:hypothetical protein
VALLQGAGANGVGVLRSGPDKRLPGFAKVYPFAHVVPVGPIRAVVLWKNPDANIPGCHADDEGENDRSFITSGTKPDRLTRH